MQKTADNLLTFAIATILLFFAMASFILIVLFLYRRKQQNFIRDIEKLKLDHEKASLNAQLEIQEQTFKHVSGEIHDNISLTLTLAKLQLHTLNPADTLQLQDRLSQVGNLISKAIKGLNDISRSMDANVLMQQGLLRALEEEVARIRKTGLFDLRFEVNGDPLYLDARQELLVFRVIQEAFNNCIKHAQARNSLLRLDYGQEALVIEIADDGRGFDTELARQSTRAGLQNIQYRVEMLRGSMQILSEPGKGSRLHFTIPYQKQSPDGNQTH